MQTFKKVERLCSQKIIDALFKQGSSFFIRPFKVTWLNIPIDSKYPAQILITVSKNQFKKAVDRNKIKRQIRESYRKNKSFFYESLLQHNSQCVFALSFVAKEKVSYQEIESKIILILRRLQEEYEKVAK